MTISFAMRSQLFTQLATLSGAGIAPGQAWGMIRLNRQIDTKLAQVKRALARGESIAKAGRKAGVLTPLEAALIGAGEGSGDPTGVLKKLGDYYTQRDTEWRQIRSRTTSPALLAVAALLIPPIPQLYTGAMTAVAYFTHFFAVTGGAAALVLGGRWLWQRFERSKPAPERMVWDRLILSLPVIGGLHRRRCLADFWSALAMLEEAGVPLFEAFPMAVNVVNNGVLQQALAPVLQVLHKGQSLASALKASALFRADHLIIGMVHSGESAGRLAEHLQRVANAEQTALGDAQRRLADWLPRVVYALVAGWVIFQLIGGSGFHQRLPDVG
jgi:general secretion pathway protein F